MDDVARGTFEIEFRPPVGEADPPGLGRLEFDKTFTGGLLGTSRGAMLSAGDPATGSAGYVVIEVVDGSVAGRSGTFALQHSGTLHDGEQQLAITVVPGSGTGGLAGIGGELDLTVDGGGVHHYELRYRL